MEVGKVEHSPGYKSEAAAVLRTHKLHDDQLRLKIEKIKELIKHADLAFDRAPNEEAKDYWRGYGSGLYRALLLLEDKI